MNYNYASAERIAKKLKLVWLPSWVENFDQHAKAHNFTQAQVDLALHHHLVQVQHLFSRKTYKLHQRIKLAFHFLFGW